MSSKHVWVLCPRCRATYPDGFRVCPTDGETLTSTTVDPLLGAILDERYRVEEMIGEGLLGRVYRARNVRIRRQCAIKIPADGSLIHGQATQRLLNEAEAGGRIDHPNVVAVLDLGEVSAGQPYLVMELAEGETLRKRLARSNGLPVAVALALAHQLALGLEHAHGCGLVHRDLTPDNVVIGANGRARILDFGLALVMDGDSKRLTAPGLVIGTPPYMAPEQAAGERIDARADLYSLGVLLYEMIAGRVPFDGTPTELARKTIFWTPPRLGERIDGLTIDPAIDDLIQWMLARHPADRIESATAVARALAVLVVQHTVASPDWQAAPEPASNDWADVPTARIAAFALRPSS
jgi:serine/threonine-protein kinase